MAPIVNKSNRPAVRPRVLIVDDESDMVDTIRELVGKECRTLVAKSLDEARRMVESERIELLVADVHLPDGDGTSLLPLLHRHQPSASAIVITGEPSMDGAIAALRHGAVDFLLKPFTATDLRQRVQSALKRQAVVARNEKRLDKLRDAVRRLNDARKVVTKKVDLLCNDLIGAYGELSRQLDVVRTQEGFKQFMGNTADLEQLLCHTMDYFMRQCGYCNIAIWLAGDDSDFQLGAYMKYTIAGDKELTGAMRRGIVAQAARDGFVRLSGETAQERLTAAELDFLADQDLMAVNCTYLGETLAVVVLFRDAAKGFVDADAACLRSVSPLFAVALASVVRGAQKGEEGGGDTLDDDAPNCAGHEDDWWKKGEEPPF